MNMKQERATPEVAFTIKCDGCELPVYRLGEQFRPAGYKNIDLEYECLLVGGYKTPTHTVKYFPARAGIRWARGEGLFGRGKKIFVPSSGNFLLSVVHVVMIEGLDIEIIGVVSSKLGAGKRADLDKLNIRLLTEIDLANALGRDKSGDMFEMLEAYSRDSGIPILHQYNCDRQGGWNYKSYLPISTALKQVIGDKVPIFPFTAGTKGKGRGIDLGLKVAVFPCPGQSFPGGRDEQGIRHVGNDFGLEPIRRRLNHLVAYHMAGDLYAAGIPVGITAAAELATGQHFSLEYLEPGRNPNDIAFGRKITLLVVASDTIGPYKEEGMEHVPHLFRDMVDPRLLAA